MMDSLDVDMESPVVKLEPEDVAPEGSFPSTNSSADDSFIDDDREASFHLVSYSMPVSIFS